MEKQFVAIYMIQPDDRNHLIISTSEKGYPQISIRCSARELYELINGSCRYVEHSVYSEEAFMDSLKNATDADDVYLEFPSEDVYLCLEYSIDKADKAVKTFEKMAKHEFSIAITNLEGELRLYSDNNTVSTSDWLSILENR